MIAAGSRDNACFRYVAGQQVHECTPTLKAARMLHETAAAVGPEASKLGRMFAVDFLIFERGFKVYVLRPRVLRLLVGHHDENVSERFRSNNENDGKNYHTI